MSRRRFLVVAGAGFLGACFTGLGYDAIAGALQPARHGPGSSAGATPLSTPPPAGTPVPQTPPAGVPAVVDAPATRWQYRSAPTLHPPVVTVSAARDRLAPGLVLLTPGNGAPSDGPTIVDDSGEPVWVRPEDGLAATNLQVADFRGAPVLTWWEGTIVQGHGEGDYVIIDSTYQEVARVHAGHGYQGDLHEFLPTSRGTAFLSVYNALADRTSPSGAGLLEGVIQEVDIATGQVVFEWHSAEHVDMSESFADPTKGLPYDYFHLNSIAPAADGNLLVSARHTWTVYKIDRATGAILWRLGGKRSDFSMKPGASFAWQHHVRQHVNGTLTVFDNGASGQGSGPETESRGLVLRLDTATMTATLVRAYVRPVPLLATSQGSVQTLSNGNVFVGWGAAPYCCEFDAQGGLVFDAAFPASARSYRAFRAPWTGRPAQPPACAVDATAEALTVYVSWNGATEVAAWELLTGISPDSLISAGSTPRSGFETAIQLPAGAQYVAARGRDASGRVLGTSPAQRVSP